MPAIVAKRPKDPSTVNVVRGFLDSAIHFDLLNDWLTGFIGELEAGSDPVDAACTSAEEWDFGGFIGSLGCNENEARLPSAVLKAGGQLSISQLGHRRSRRVRAYHRWSLRAAAGTSPVIRRRAARTS
jgi:hypothetical protein